MVKTLFLKEGMLDVGGRSGRRCEAERSERGGSGHRGVKEEKKNLSRERDFEMWVYRCYERRSKLKPQEVRDWSQSPPPAPVPPTSAAVEELPAAAGTAAARGSFQGAKPTFQEGPIQERQERRTSSQRNLSPPLEVLEAASREQRCWPRGSRRWRWRWR